MKEKRSRSLLRLGLAAALACGMTPAVALAEPEAQITERPPHRGGGGAGGGRRGRRREEAERMLDAARSTWNDPSFQKVAQNVEAMLARQSPCGQQ